MRFFRSIMQLFCYLCTWSCRIGPPKRMINHKLVWSILGQLLLFMALLLAICLGVAYYYGESAVVAFGIPLGIVLIASSVLRYMGRGYTRHFNLRDGFYVVSLVWIVFSLFGTLPFLLSGTTDRFAHACFESFSGFTTTGATVIASLDTLPHSINFWRVLTQWIGGVGIVFFTIAIIPTIGGGEQKLFSAETTGLKLVKLHPRIATTAHWIGSIYLFLTIACAACFFFAGMNGFDAVSHAFTTISTGGFSTHDASIGHFQSPAIEWVAIAFMLVSGINFALLYLLFIKRRWRDIWKDEELRLFLGSVAAIALCCTLALYFHDHREPMEALRASVFQAVSIQTTTGYVTENFMTWGFQVWFLLMLAGFCGACTGSTTGGVKCARVVTLWKLLRNEFLTMLHPRAYYPLRINRQIIAPHVIHRLCAFFLVYLSLLAVGTFVLLLTGLEPVDAFACAASSLNNVGASTGATISPVDTFASIPDLGLWTCTLLMLAGRLEIFSLLIIFTPGFWRKQ